MFYHIPFFVISPSPPDSLPFRYKSQILGLSLWQFPPDSDHLYAWSTLLGSFALEEEAAARQGGGAGLHGGTVPFSVLLPPSPSMFCLLLWQKFNNTELVPSCSLCLSWQADAWHGAVTVSKSLEVFLQFRFSFLGSMKIFPNQDGTRQVSRAEVEGLRVCTIKQTNLEICFKWSQ